MADTNNDGGRLTAARERMQRRKIIVGFVDDTDEQRKEPEATLRLSNGPPGGATTVLLHSCCAPCSGAQALVMQEMGLSVSIFFYNPNIHPRAEYEIRKEENKRFAAELGIPFVDADYDSGEWFARAKGMEFEPERGQRCTMCFDMRLERTALYAYEHKFACFTTTNATSRWKDQQQVNDSGERAAAKYPGVSYWRCDWQTDELTRLKYEISADFAFYKQEYCGCTYSLRDSNLWRKSQGLGPVQIGGSTASIGSRWFSDPVVDEQEESREVIDAFFKKAEAHFDDAWSEMYAHRRKADKVDLNNW